MAKINANTQRCSLALLASATDLLLDLLSDLLPDLLPGLVSEPFPVTIMR